MTFSGNFFWLNPVNVLSVNHLETKNQRRQFFVIFSSFFGIQSNFFETDLRSQNLNG